MFVDIWITFYLFSMSATSVLSGGCGGCGYCTVTLPCVHGTCNTPDGGEHYTCHCEPGWGSTNCDIVDCSNSANHCENGGQCNSVAGGTSFTCTCTYGWVGNNCDTADCSVYCQNGGTCNHINGGTSHQCSCAEGWMGDDCQYVDCSNSANHCHNGGQCNSVGDGTTFTCTCTNGWMGDECGTADCSVYCQNGGTCNHINGGTSHQCSCAAGWMGDDCQYVDCSNSAIHCQNGGQCNSVGDGTTFSCSCTTGWLGDDCGNADCSVYCQNGGTCSLINGGTSHQCTCAVGWFGDDCEYVDCSNSAIHCENGGQCNSVTGGTSFTCTCTLGWIGNICETADCSVFCQNGGTCSLINGGSSHQCRCVDGWMGDDCQYIDCSNSAIHCRNGGLCNTISGGTSFTCTCTHGWIGDICETVDCSVYCQNGGTCNHVNGGTSHQCSCAEGWKGDDCQYVDCSSSIYCVNGGACIPINNGTEKTCICEYGWTGPNCEDIDVCTPYDDADIVFAIDTSESQDGSAHFEDIKPYVKNFISQFPIGPFDYRFQFSLLTYSSEPVVHIYLNEYQNMTDLLAAADSITPSNSGLTYTGKMLKTVREEILTSSNGARNSVKQYVVVLTDGLSTDSQDTRIQADYLRSMGVLTYAVGSGGSVLHEELLNIATYHRHVFTISTSDALQSLLHKSMFGCNDCADRMTDVALLMDVSASTSPTQLDGLIKAMVHVVKQSNIGSSAIQFSFTTFSNRYKTVYNLDQYSDSTEHIVAINTNIVADTVDDSTVSDVLTYTSANVFSTTNGGRPDARKVAIIFSAGNFSDAFEDIKTTAQSMKDTGVIVVAVGIGRYTHLTNLKTLASDPSLIYVIGEDMFTSHSVLDSLRSLIEYTDCSHFR